MAAVEGHGFAVTPFARSDELSEQLADHRIDALAIGLAVFGLLSLLAMASDLVGPVDEDELYTALDWLRARQPAIETALARRHRRGGTLVLSDVSSSYLEGRCCALARLGYNRDGKKGKMQIVYGLLCAADGLAAETGLGPRSPTRRPSGGDRGVRGRCRRPEAPRHADRQAQAAL